jgi:integrase
MAFKRDRGSGWEYVFKKAGVLKKPLYLTFDTEEEGDAYAAKLEALLDRGIVPTEHQTVSRITNIRALVDQYLRDAHPKDKDIGALGTVCNAVGKTPLDKIDAKWVDNWVTDMKRQDKVAPATIRAKVGALARCCDWGIRNGLLLMPDHPLRTLPKGYAQYTDLDADVAGVKRVDIERDRRLEEGEYERIIAVIDRGVLPRKQRPYQLPDSEALKLLFNLGLESAMRLREMYTLTTDQVNLLKKTIFLDKTKNGDRRQVPITTVAYAALKAYLDERKLPPGPMFPWWNGSLDKKYLHDTSDFLSKLFVNIFEEAGCKGFTFHCTRHEATSRIYERTNLTDLQISRLTGHRSLVMLRRYSNLRGSDLAKSLW